MTTVNVLEAKTHFSKLLARAEQGEEIIVARAGKPVVRLVPVEELPPREFGFGWPGFTGEISDSFFFDPLPPEELALWLGEVEREDDPLTWSMDPLP
uniref:Putative type II toxin-antitoxin system family protein n=1 Tax=termite gut metagenome TaxID=433724 RepID=S0DEC7_9ZZZZ